MFDLLNKDAHEVRAMMKPLVIDIFEGGNRKHLTAFRKLGIVRTNLALRRIFQSLVADYAREGQQSQPATVIAAVIIYAAPPIAA
jgi:hypothetical protein